MKKVSIQKKTILIISVSILICFFILGIILATKIYTKNTNNNDTETPTNNSTETKEEFLYRISYITRNTKYEDSGYIYVYDFSITEEYDVLTSSKKLSSNEQQDYSERVDGIYSLSLDKILDELKNEEHSKTIELNNKQKEILKNTLENEKYKTNKTSYIDLNGFESYYLVINNKTNMTKSMEIESQNVILTEMVNYFITENLKYFDYLAIDNDIKNYIKDNDYKELDISSELVNNLYSKSIFDNRKSNNVLDNYIENKITNDYLITLVLQQLTQDKKIKDKCYYDDYLEHEWCDSYFSNDDFEVYAKKLFGNDVKYDISSYKGQVMPVQVMLLMEKN